MLTKKKIYALFFGIFIVVGCHTTTSKYPTSVEETHNSLREAWINDNNLTCRKKPIPSAVRNALVPQLTVQLPQGASQPNQFDVAAKEVPAKTFFMSLMQGMPYNIIVDPKVSGNITLNLQKVTVDETLAAVRDLYGYDYRRTSYGYEILPAELQTRIFNLNFLDIKRSGHSQTSLVTTDLTIQGPSASATGGIGYSAPGGVGGASQGSGTAMVTDTTREFWKNIDTVLNSLVGTGEGRKVVVNPISGVIVVKAYPAELREVARYIDAIQQSVQRQVIIEAKILEVTLSHLYQAGIDWSAFAKGLRQIGSDTSVIPRDFTGMLNVTISANHGSFTAAIKLLEQQGNVQVMASPHVATLNNQEAVIKVGNDQYYVTNLTSNITPSGTTNTTSQSIGLTPFFSGVTLDVTPQISEQGDITLYLHPSVSDVKEQTKTIDLGTSGGVVKLPSAASAVREADTVVRAKSGEIIIIGGLMENSAKQLTAEVPGATKIPFAGSAFRDVDQQSTKTEVVILLRPIIANNSCAWSKRAQYLAERMQTDYRGFYLGSNPEIYGNMAEIPDQTQNTD